MIEQRSCCVLALPGVTEIELGAYFVLSYAVVCMQAEMILLLAVIDQTVVNRAYGSICPFPTDSDSLIR